MRGITAVSTISLNLHINGWLHWTANKYFPMIVCQAVCQILSAGSIWMSFLSGCMSNSLAVSPICMSIQHTIDADFSVLRVFSEDLVEILVLKIQF